MTNTGRTIHAMYPLVERCLQGHQTQKVFCREHSLSTSVLNYWLAKYRRQPGLPRVARGTRGDGLSAGARTQQAKAAHVFTLVDASEARPGDHVGAQREPAAGRPAAVMPHVASGQRAA